MSPPESMNHKPWTEHYHPIDTINNPPLVVTVRQVATAEAEEAAVVVGEWTRSQRLQKYD